MKEKKIYLIAAMSDNRVIGIENRLPWHFSSDLKKFKELTTGNTVIMGRKTFESLGSQPLPNRENIVLTQSSTADQDVDIKFSDSLQNAIQASSKERIFIIGGQSIYEQALRDLPVSGIYLTQIHQTFPGDAHFPQIPDSFKEKGKPEILHENPKIEFIYLENTVIQ